MWIAIANLCISDFHVVLVSSEEHPLVLRLCPHLRHYFINNLHASCQFCWVSGGAPDKEAQLLESWKAYKTGFQQGIALFNKKPKKGIAFMLEQVKPSHMPKRRKEGHVLVGLGIRPRV